MKKKDLDFISDFLGKLDNYQFNNTNKQELQKFISEMENIIPVSFLSQHILIKKIHEIRFTPKYYFPEMKANETMKAWDSGIQELKKILSEIIQESKNHFDFSDLPTIEYILAQSIETNKIEFKSSLRWDLKTHTVNKDLEKVVLKTICAFNNFEGGNLFIGVADDGTILGLEDDFKTFSESNRDKFELHLRNLINAAYSKSFIAKNIEIHFPRPLNIEICQVIVKKGGNPLFLEATNSKGNDKKDRFYIRIGNQSVEIEKIPDLVEYAIKHFGTKE